MDFKKLGEVATVEEILDTDTVLVARDGQIYRADKSKVGGGAGGYLLEPADAEIVATDTAEEHSQFYITSKIDDVLKGVKAGAPLTVKMDGKHISNTYAGTSIYIAISSFASGGSLETDMPGVVLYSGGFNLLSGDFALFAFTNGGPVPGASSTSTTSVNAISALASKLHDKPVVEVANGVD